MTEQARVELEKDVLHGASVAKRNSETVKAKLSLIGERLERLGRALQVHPEVVMPLLEVNAEFDYRDGLNELGSAHQQIIDLCNELRASDQKKAAAERRMASLGL